MLNDYFALRVVAAFACVIVSMIAAAEGPATQPASQPAEKYRDLKREDGFNFGAYVAEMVFTFGGKPSGTLTKFTLVIIPAEHSKVEEVELELVDKDFNEGRIRTKMFGDIMVEKGRGMYYSATESQIKKIQEFIAARKNDVASTKPTK